MPKLVFLSPEFVNQECELPEGRVTLGRGPQNDLVLRDPSVSAVHCGILVSGPEVILQDQGSSNGTYVDEQRVAGQCGVNPGQRIRFGQVVAHIEPDDAEWEARDNSTEFTAVLSMRHALKTEAGPPRRMPVFPVIFSPTSVRELPGQGMAAPKPDIAPLQPSISPAAPASAAPLPGVRRGPPWVGVAVAVIVLTTGVGWLLWR